MPSTDFNESRRIPKFPATVPADQPQEQLPCPRCHSNNTKFCYYNNYNFSQPRHFCKACRRYWTHGGTLRDIPVGGVSRKSSKRSKISSSSAAAAAASNAVVGTRNFPLQATPVLFPPSSNGVNTAAKGHSFTPLLNYNATVRYGFNGLDGFGLGLGHGSYFDDVRFGQTGITGWPFSSAGVAASSVADATTVTTSSHVAPLPSTWQFDGPESKMGFVSGDYN